MKGYVSGRRYWVGRSGFSDEWADSLGGIEWTIS